MLILKIGTPFLVPHDPLKRLAKILPSVSLRALLCRRKSRPPLHRRCEPGLHGVSSSTFNALMTPFDTPGVAIFFVRAVGTTVR